MSKRSILAMMAAATAASCAPRTPAPVPTPPVVRPQVQPPQPLPAPAPAAWEDAPLAFGDWTYRSDGGVSSASFGTAFILRCEADRRISLVLTGAARGPLTLRTSYGARSIPAEPRQGALVASLPAGDALLDQIIFSRGRFAVEAEGINRLIVPAWGEPARVIEDCR